MEIKFKTLKSFWGFKVEKYWIFIVSQVTRINGILFLKKKKLEF